jgi:membrane-bound lytic murein transglycosylase
MKDPKIIGIGGVFFKAKSAENLQNWYQNQLGLVLNPYGATFEMRHSKNPKKQNTFTGIFSPMTQHTSNHLKKTL